MLPLDWGKVPPSRERGQDKGAVATGSIHYILEGILQLTPRFARLRKAPAKRAPKFGALFVVCKKFRTLWLEAGVAGLCQIAMLLSL